MQVLTEQNVSVELVDLRDYDLPFCDGSRDCVTPNVTRLSEQISRATDILFATPIYNFDVNSAAKNAVELLGRAAFADKTVGFMAAGGGKGSFMAVMGLANSLMLDFRCLVVPRFVYAISDDFGLESTIANPDIVRRIELLVNDLLSITRTAIPTA
jgi:FMN reductase